MDHDGELAARVRARLHDEPGVVEKRMFAGLAFLVGGHMALATDRAGELMVRVDPSEIPDLVERPGVTRTVMRGRETGGWLDVGTEGTADDADLAEWVGRGLAAVHDLPPKGGAG